jgi:hypothetical protein
MKYLRIILKIIFGSAIMYGMFALSENSFIPGNWAYIQRQHAAVYFLCVVIFAIVSEAQLQSKTRKK